MSGEGPTILDNMQDFYESKARSAILIADQFVEQKEADNEQNHEEPKATKTVFGFSFLK